MKILSKVKRFLSFSIRANGYFLSRYIRMCISGFHQKVKLSNLIKALKLSKLSNLIKIPNLIKPIHSFKGAILIELAFSIPIFMALLYYIHDVPLLQRWKSRMEQVSFQAAQMLQVVSDGEKITKTNHQNAMSAGVLTIFPGAIICPTDDNHYQLGYYVSADLYYVKGEADGKASVKWRLESSYSSNIISSSIYYTDNNASVVRYKTNVNPSEIYADLQINEGEVKMISEVVLKYDGTSYFSDGRKSSSVSDREKFNFLFLTPEYSGNTSSDFCFFNSVIIFTPNVGLFDETPPS